MNSEKPSEEINIIFIGNSNVGKTAILKSYINQKFIGGSSSTLGIDYINKKAKQIMLKV